MKMRYLFYIRCLLASLTLILLLAACNQGNGNSAGTGKSSVSTTTSAGIQLGPQPCPASVHSATHWNAIVGATGARTVKGVICGYLMGVSELQAVVKVLSGGANFPLDIDVYTSITSSKPARIFALSGLSQGEVSISNYNTLLTAQVDPDSSRNKDHPSSEQLVDLYREFKWSDSAGTLVPVAFNGIYPDLTRYQAEFEQQEVNSGQGFQQWRLSAITTSQNFAEFVLGWNPSVPAALTSGGGAHDARATVLIKNPSAGNVTIKLSLSRLELNTNGGIWEVTGVATDGMALTSPQSSQQLASPVQVAGKNTAFAGNLTSATIFDHDRTAIGQVVVVQAGEGGKRTFSTRVPYLPSFQGGEQEGIIALYTYTQNHVIIGAVMEKVLLSA